MKSRRALAFLVLMIIAVTGAAVWRIRVPEAASPKPAVVMECVQTVAQFEVLRYDASAVTAPAPDIPVDSPCAEALAVLLSADFHIRGVVAPQYGHQYYVLSH